MFSMVRIILLLLLTSSIVMGGLGVQQGDSSFLKGGAGLLIVAFLLVIIYKVIWKAMGCFLVIAIVLIGAFILFSGTGLMPSMSSIGKMIPFMNNESSVVAPQQVPEMPSPPPPPLQEKKDNFIEILPEKIAETPVVVEEKIIENQEILPETEMLQPQNVVFGTARIINGDTIQIGNRIIRLFGIDAPEPSQTCATRTGTSYRCGQKAALELRKMLGNSEVVCNIMEQNARGHAIGTCAVGPYDVGAAMISNGWAVAYRQFSGDVYVPYENNARSQQLGLWEGEFYMPWDWREHNAMQKKSLLETAIPMPTKSRGSSSSIGEGIINSILKMF